MKKQTFAKKKLLKIVMCFYSMIKDILKFSFKSEIVFKLMEFTLTQPKRSAKILYNFRLKYLVITEKCM